MNTRIPTLCLLSLLVPPGVNAASETKPAWTLEGQLGGVLTAGNTETSSLNLGLTLKTELGRCQTRQQLQWLYKEENGTASADRLQYDGRVERTLDANRALFYSSQLLRDRFAGYNRQDSLLLGYRHQWKHGAHSLQLRPALGYRISEAQNRNDTDDELILGLGAEYQWTWSESSRLENRLQMDWGQENVHSSNTLSVHSQLNGKLSLKVSLLLDHNSSVPPERKNLDTTTSVNLVYQLH